MRTVPIDEQETTINLEAILGVAEVYSCEPTMMRKLEKLAKEHPDEVTLEHPDGYGIIAHVPKGYVSVRAPKKMNYTDEQRRVLAERAKALRARQLGR